MTLNLKILECESRKGRQKKKTNPKFEIRNKFQCSNKDKIQNKLVSRFGVFFVLVSDLDIGI